MKEVTPMWICGREDPRKSFEFVCQFFFPFFCLSFVCLFVLSKRGGVYGNIEVGILSVQVGNENL